MVGQRAAATATGVSRIRARPHMPPCATAEETHVYLSHSLTAGFGMEF